MTAIRIEKLGKRYLVSHEAPRGRYRTLRESVMHAAAAPLRRLRGERSATREEFWALKDVSLEVEPGEVVGIIGRNGAGKSTLLKVLSQITRPTIGRVRLSGRVGSLLEVGTGFHPELTGRENIYLNGSILGMTRREIERRFDEIVAFAEIEQFLDTPVKRYSSGMYVRLAFGVAAHLEPEILIVDEVLAVGDAGFQKKCLAKMDDVAQHGRTILFVSHNMAAVSQLCTRAVWLDGGKLEQSGETQQVIAAYLSKGAQTRAARQWPDPTTAPGDDRVRLLSASVVQSEMTTALVDINQPTAVELEFAILRPVRNLVTGVSAYTREGICAFAHCDWRPNQFAPGRYRKRMELPAHFLAEGRLDLLVQLVFYDPSVQSVVLPAALSINAVESACADAVRGPYKGAWPGIVRPHFAWSDAVPEAPAAARLPRRAEACAVSAE